MKKVLKWTGLSLAGLVGLLLVAGIVLFLIGRSRAASTYETPTERLITTVPTDSAAIARGDHLATILSCRFCHGEDLTGKVFLDIPPFRATARNLTTGAGGLQGYSVQDIDRALRFGVKPDGRMVFVVMPSKLFSRLSDDDTAALVAYLRSLPPTDSDLAPTEIRMPGYLMFGAPNFDAHEYLPPADTPHPSVTPAPTAEYGAYLANVSCVECHGQDLMGGEHPSGEGVTPGLAAAAAWPIETFATAMRTGVRPSGLLMDPEYMPWATSYKALTDLEMEALYQHLQTLVRE